MEQLQPGDQVTELTDQEAFLLIISAATIRGIDASWNILDQDALRHSLEANGQDESQIAAILDEEVSIDTYMRLTESEVACLKDFGVQVAPIRIDQEPGGLSKPSYGFAVGDSGYSAGQLNHIQAWCQNKFTGAYQLIYRAKLGPSLDEQEAMDVKAANDYLDCVRGFGGEPPFDAISSATIGDFFSWFATDETPGCHLNPGG